jgi:hypothetical protein
VLDRCGIRYQARFELMSGAGHFLQEDAGAELAQLIVRWADELEARRPALLGRAQVQTGASRADEAAP